MAIQLQQSPYVTDKNYQAWFDRSGISKYQKDDLSSFDQYITFASDPNNFSSYQEYRSKYPKAKDFPNAQVPALLPESAFSQVKKPASSAPVSTVVPGASSITTGAPNPTSDVYISGQPTDSAGRPLKNAFVSIIDPKTGLLRPEYQLGSSLDRSGIDAIKNEALRKGPSAWANLQKSFQRDELMKNADAQAVKARAELAMRGGLASGASERLARESMNSALLGGQNISRQIAMQDEANRMNMLSQLPGQQLAVANYDTGISQRNTDNALREIMQKRAYDANAYGEAMRAWGAEKTAAATPSSGGKK